VESTTKNRKRREQIARMVEKASGISLGRYTLYLALVMKTECYYRNYDSDDVSNLAKQLLVPTLN